MCKEMDKDGSGSLTLPELLNGYETNQTFEHLLKAMDIRKDDLVAVFSILDDDGSGDVAYKEFVEQLHKMKTDDSHTMLVFIKHYVVDLRNQVFDEMKIIQTELPGAIKALDEKVTRQLDLILQGMKSNESSTEMIANAADKKVEEAKDKLQGEAIQLEQDLGMQGSSTVASLSSMPSMEKESKALPRAPNSISPVSGPSSQVGASRIIVDLESLIQRCNQSVSLLTSYHNSLPEVVDPLPILQGASSVGILRHEADGLLSWHPAQPANGIRPGPRNGQDINWPPLASGCCNPRFANRQQGAPT